MREAVKRLSLELIEAGKILADSGLVIATWGNISCRIPDTQYFLITPSGMPYRELRAEDLVLMSLTGEIIEGTRKPSSEWMLHQEIYSNRPDAAAVVHTHSTSACAFAVAGERIPPILEEMAQLIGGAVEVADYAPPGTKVLAHNAVMALGEKNAVLLANHGAAALGRDLAEALTIARLTEKAAQVVLGAKILGTQHSLSDQEVKALREDFIKHYGQKNHD